MEIEYHSTLQMSIDFERKIEIFLIFTTHAEILYRRIINSICREMKNVKNNIATVSKNRLKWGTGYSVCVFGSSEATQDRGASINH